METIGGMLSKVVYQSDNLPQMPQFGGIKIYVSDIFSADAGGAAVCVDDDITMNYLLSGKDYTIIQKAVNNPENNLCIVISEQIAGWKDTNPEWYYFIIGHEYGHINYRHAHKDKQTRLPRETDAYEIQADSTGENLSKLSLSEKIKCLKAVQENAEALIIKAKKSGELKYLDTNDFHNGTKIGLAKRFGFLS